MIQHPTGVPFRRPVITGYRAFAGYDGIVLDFGVPIATFVTVMLWNYPPHAGFRLLPHASQFP
jgi:hypothetical protein